MVLRVLDGFWCHVGVQDNGIVSNQSPVILVVGQMPFALGKGCSSAKDPTEQLECLVYPPVLVDLCDAIPLNARDEEHDQKPFAPDLWWR